MAMTTYAGAAYQPRKTRSFTALFRGIQDRLRFRSRHTRDLEALRNANDHLLADLGLSRGQLARVLNTTPTFAGYDPVGAAARHAFRRI